MRQKSLTGTFLAAFGILLMAITMTVVSGCTSVEEQDSQSLIDDLAFRSGYGDSEFDDVEQELIKRGVEGSVPMDTWMNAARNPDSKIRMAIAAVIGDICLQLEGPDEAKFVPVLIAVLKADEYKSLELDTQEAFGKVEFANGFGLLTAETANINALISDHAEEALTYLSTYNPEDGSSKPTDPAAVHFLAGRITSKSEAETWLNSKNEGFEAAAREWASANGYSTTIDFLPQQ